MGGKIYCYSWKRSRDVLPGVDGAVEEPTVVIEVALDVALGKLDVVFVSVLSDMVKADVDADELLVKFEVLAIDMDGEIDVERVDVLLLTVVVGAVPSISVCIQH